jgi:O-antigen/teichoic acid export membrane protein
MPEIKNMKGTPSGTAPAGSARLTSGSLLARNAFWNLVGSGAPMLVAIFCIPVLIRELGTDRFGVLTLAWAVIGYAGLFDLGLGRALTQLVASKLGAGEDKEVPTLVWTSLLMMLVLGLLGALVVDLLSPWLVHRALHVPIALQNETLKSFYLLGLSIPVVISTAGLRGLLEAQQHFGIINALRIPMGILSFVAPLLVLPFSKSLFPIVAVLVVGRVIAWIAHLLVCLRVTTGLNACIAWDRAAVDPLLRFGGWMTVSNIVGPLMVTLDRFLIGAMLSVSAVAYYATPYEVVTKIWVVPSALVGVMFPAFSTTFVRDVNRTGLLFGRAVKIIFLALFPVTLLIVAFAGDGLNLWLGADFAGHSARILQWLAAGVFVNSLALLPFSLVQGVGRPDVTAKLHLLELPVYALALWWLVARWGIEGAAIAWTARAIVDALALFLLAGRFSAIPTLQPRRTLVPIMVALVIFAISGVLPGIVSRAIFLLVVCVIYGVTAWFQILSLEERTLVLSYLKQVQVSD